MLRDVQKTEFKMFGVKAFYNRQLPYSPQRRYIRTEKSLPNTNSKVAARVIGRTSLLPQLLQRPSYGLKSAFVREMIRT